MGSKIHGPSYPFGSSGHAARFPKRMKLRIQGHDVQVEPGFPAGSGIRDYAISGPFVNTRGFYHLGADSSEAAIEAYTLRGPGTVPT